MISNTIDGVINVEPRSKSSNTPDFFPLLRNKERNFLIRGTFSPFYCCYCDSTAGRVKYCFRASNIFWTVCDEMLIGPFLPSLPSFPNPAEYYFIAFLWKHFIHPSHQPSPHRTMYVLTVPASHMWYCSLFHTHDTRYPPYHTHGKICFRKLLSSIVAYINVHKSYLSYKWQIKALLFASFFPCYFCA